MDIDFYNSILPPVGLRCLAVFKGGLKVPPTHSFYDNNEDLLAAAATYDGLGKNVYHACASYTTSDSRKGENTAAVKSLWIDLDVGPKKPYATQKEAASHAEQFRAALDLPFTHVVSSGGGVHVYLPFTKAVLPDQWARLAALFAACLDKFGVAHDTSRTEDRASVLRVHGTSNYKTDPAKAVKLVRRGVETPAAAIYAKLKEYADANGVIAGTKPAKGTPQVTNDLIGAQEYPPSEGPLVAQHCPTIKEVADTGGDVGYEVWWRAMGVAKSTTEPQVVAMHWTRNRAATGHNKADWQKTIDEWPAGPTTCAEFSKHSSHCASCPKFGKLTSPIQLGVPAQPVVAPLQTALLQAPPKRTWGFGEQWIMDAISAVTRTGFSNNKMTMSVQQEDGSYKHIPFCDRYWQVMRRVRGADGVWQLEIGYELYPGMPHKTFLLDSAAVTSPDLFRKEFSARELHIYGGQRAMQKAQEVVRYTQSLQYDHQEETATVPTMGWVTTDNAMNGELTGEFVIGNTVLAPKQPPREVLLADTVDSALRADFRTKGTTADWVGLIDHVYNRPHAEAYQFIIAASFAAPLVKLVPGGGEWHGIPLVISGASGAAKTTTAMVGMSVYTMGQTLRFSANARQGDTINALSLKVGSLRSLPFIMDEMSEVDAERVGDIMYMLANGKAKDRMGPNGKMIPNPFRWDTLSLVTANESLHEVLKGLRSQQSTEATQLRSFEVWLDNNVHSLFKGINKNTIEVSLLEEQFGCVGRDWLQFVVNNRVAIQEKLKAMRAKYMIDANDTSAIRFYKDLILTVSVAAHLAKAKGFIKWDVQAMISWAERQLISLRDSVGTKDWDGTISDYVASLHGRTIVTKHMKLGRGRRTNNEVPLEPLSTSHIPVARNAIDDRIFVITANSLRDWAQERRILPSTLLAEMVQRGYILGAPAGTPGEKAAVVTPRLINIGSGTLISRPQAPCYELNYDKVSFYSEGDSAPAAANVVQFPTAEQPADSEEAAATSP